MRSTALRLGSVAPCSVGVLLAFVAFGCSGGTSASTPDAGPLVADGAIVDAGRDGAVDAGRDAAVDAGGDGAVDAGQDGAVDAGLTGPCGVELCDNGLDDDCDGVIENGCTCIAGTRRGCFRGPADSRGRGACTDGTMLCADGVDFGTWGPCEGDVLPAVEVCDAAGVDESCDGAVNEGCGCDPAAGPVACGTDEGACVAGTQACVDGVLGACSGAIDPTVETCNGLDDDCNGSVDEGLHRACGSHFGECLSGTETCVAGAFGACEGATGPTAENCDGLDNDCDGLFDEDLVRECGSAVGACLPGTQTCVVGAWSACAGETLPSVETCNGLDDDCDALTDETLTRACGSSVGLCRPGVETCDAGAFGACVGGVGPASELCDGRNDENCNGTVDEGCGCTAGTPRACGTDVGACVAGTQTCTTGGLWGACAGSVGPVVETCNSVDDDCNGLIDDGGVCATSPPIATCPAAIDALVLTTASVSGSGSDPDGGAVTYAWTVTSRPVGSSATPTPATSRSPSFLLDASGSYTLRFCVTDNEGQTTCCDVPVTSRAPAGLHVEVAWSTEFGDVDAHVLSTARTSPDGWFTADDCYYDNPTPDWGTTGPVADPALERDDTSGYGPENVTLSTLPATGRYTVGVHYFCSHSDATGPLTPGDGPTRVTVRLYCDGALLATYSDVPLDRTDDWRDVANVDYPGCVGTSIDRVTNGSSLLPAAFTKSRHCEMLCATDADCPVGETCTTIMGTGGGGRRLACVLL